MLELELSTSPGFAVIRASGTIRTADDADTLVAAMSFVPVDDHLVLDVTAVEHLRPACARAIRDSLAERQHAAESVIVSTRPDITLQLVLVDADRLAPVVATHDDAIAILRVRAGIGVAEVA